MDLLIQFERHLLCIFSSVQSSVDPLLHEISDSLKSVIS